MPHPPCSRTGIYAVVVSPVSCMASLKLLFVRLKTRCLLCLPLSIASVSVNEAMRETRDMQVVRRLRLLVFTQIMGMLSAWKTCLIAVSVLVLSCLVLYSMVP